jgi:hypothetical protein
MQKKHFKANQKILFILALCGTLMSISLKMPHPFYLSVTEIKLHKANKQVAVSCRLFTDDLQDALYKLYRVKGNLSQKDTALNKYLEKYVNEHLQLNLDGQLLHLRCLGYEKEEEATWCYFEANAKSANDKMLVNNTLLFDFIEEQSNLIHFYNKQKRQSFKLVKPNSEALFELK